MNEKERQFLKDAGNGNNKPFDKRIDVNYWQNNKLGKNAPYKESNRAGVINGQSQILYKKEGKYYYTTFLGKFKPYTGRLLSSKEYQ